MYGSLDTKCKGQFFVIFGPCFALWPSQQPKKPKFWKNEKKFPEDIITLHLCTTNDDHMMYGSWDIERDRQNFLSFWAIVCPFTH